MTLHPTISTLHEVLSLWQRKGEPGRLLRYGEALSPRDPAGPFDAVEEFCRREKIPLDDAFLGPAMALLAGEPSAPEQAVRFILLPRLCRQLRSRDPDQAVQTAERWLRAVGLPLTAAHVRVLAHQTLRRLCTRVHSAPGCPPRPGSKPDRVGSILALYALAGHPWQPAPGRPPADSLTGRPRKALAEMLLEALRLWGTAELPAALLSHVIPDFQAGKPARVLHRLRAIRWLLARAADASAQGLDALRQCFATLLAANDPHQPIGASPAGRFLPSLAPLGKLLGASLPDGWRHVYRLAADLIETPFVTPGDEDVTSLRQAWAADLALCVRGPGSPRDPPVAGLVVTRALYRRWAAASSSAALPLTHGLVALCVALPAAAQATLQAEIWAGAGHNAEAYSVRLFRHLHTLRMFPNHDPPRACLRRFLAARPPERDIDAACIDAVGNYSLSPRPLHRAAGAMMASAAGLPHRALQRACALLLDVVFSEAQRRPSLAGRLQMEEEVARLAGANGYLLAARGLGAEIHPRPSDNQEGGT